MEDFKKNFVLLSSVAKENKYAQEYLGLLARRGDIGSIRIGKRWYTKAEWFSEFLADAETRKAETKGFSFSALPAAEKIEQKEEEKIILPRIVSPKPAPRKSFVAERKLETINLKMSRNVKPVFRRPAINIPEIRKSVPEKKSQPLAAGNSPIVDNWLRRADDPSPNFVPAGARMGFFPKFAFSMSVVLLLALLVQFGWVYKNELKGMFGAGPGIVAGARDSKTNLEVVRDSSAGYLGNQEEKVKENISLSRVLIRAAMEREK